MSQTITVDANKLALSVSELTALRNDASFSKAVNEITEATGAFGAGMTAANLAATSANLALLAKSIEKLIANTRDFLSNAGTSYVETDDGLARAILKEKLL
jgi:hypothetical protein